MVDRPQHTRGNRQVPRSRILAQSGVPLLLCCALLVVLAYNSGEKVDRDGGGVVGDDGTRLTREAAAAARASLAEIQAFAAANPDAAVEVYHRARAYVSSREPEVASAANDLCQQAIARFDPELRALLERGAALEGEGRELEAVRSYEEFLARPGLQAEVALIVRERRTQANGRVQDRFTRDVQRVRELLTRGERADAEALVAEIGRYAGERCETSARALLSEVAPVSSAELADVPADPVLLERALRGKVTPRAGGAVALRYAFDAESELEDWWTTPQSFSGPLQPSHLEPFEPKGRPAWYVAEGVLVGDGWTRRSLAIDFRADRPVTVEALVRGERNRVVALGLLPGRDFVGGSGWQLDLPLERVPHRTGALEQVVLRCRERGPTIALLREARFLELAELVATEEPPRTQARVSLELRPAGDAHTLTLQVGELRLEPVTVTLDGGPVRVFLPALGGPVGWEEVVVTGVPSPDIAGALPELGRVAGADDEALRRELRQHLRRRRPKVELR